MLVTDFKVNDGVFFDIETANEYESFHELPEQGKEAIRYLVRKGQEPESPESFYENKGTLHAEFAKIVVISVGVLDKSGVLRVKTIDDDNERDLLISFNAVLESLARGRAYICGHFIKGFDIPFIVRRCIINGVHVHHWLQNYGRKPWELAHIKDTWELWKDVGIKGASLSSLCFALRVPTPKDDIDGSMVNAVYWKEGLTRIGKYCDKDVVAVVRCLQKIVGAPMTPDEKVKYVSR